MKTKKILALVLVIVMLVGLMPQAVLAEEPVSIDLSTVSSDGTGYTCSEITVNNKPEYLVTITDSGSYTLTGTIDQFSDPTHPTHVVVSAATANITLNNVNVTLINYSPLSIRPGSTVNLTLAAGTENTLSLGASEVSLAGLSVPAGATLVIGGTGKLIARGGSAGNGAGIGGGRNQYTEPNTNRDAGIITINSGVIDATGGPYGAGIGGASYDPSSGSSVNGGIITINGGEITARSTSSTHGGAGIGGGFNGGGEITIKGGTVIATGGYNNGASGAEAIGSGSGSPAAFLSTVRIYGGSVKTLSPMRIHSTLRNTAGNVYLAIVTVQDNSGNPLSNTEISCKAGAASFTAKTDGDGKLYLWLPEGDNTIIVSSGDVMYRAAGTVSTNDSATLTASEFNPGAEVNGTMYETWSEAVSAVQMYQTITLLKDLSLSTSDRMPTVPCTIDGGTGKHKLTLNGQSLQSDITLKDLNLESADPLECTGYHLRILGNVGAEDIYIENGLEINIEGNLDIGEWGGVEGFNNISVSAGASVTAFELITTSAAIDGTVTCKYFRLGGVSAPGMMRGNGRFIFTNSGDESANIIIAADSSILDSTRITLEASGYTPLNGQMLVKAGNGNLDRFILGSGYSGFKLKYTDEDKGYVLKEVSPLKTPSISLVPDTANGGLIYTITPAAGETGTVNGYMLQLLGSDGTTEAGGAIACDSINGTIPLSSVVLSGSSYRAKVKAVAEADSDYADSSYSAACAAVQAANAPDNTNAPAVAAAKAAIVDGTVNVAYGATQEQKTAAVQSYVDGIISNTAGAAGVTATVTHGSGNQYNVALSKGGANDSKIIAMTVNETTIYTVTASAGSGGGISPRGIVNVAAGGSQTFTITPDSGYRINTVTVDSVSKGAISTYIFTDVTDNHTINAEFTRTSSGGDGGGGTPTTPTTPSTPSTPEYKAGVDNGSGSDMTLPVTVDKNNGRATVDIGTGGNFMSGGKTTVVTVPSIPGVDTYTLGIPVQNLTTPGEQGKIAFKTVNGSVVIPSNMLTGVKLPDGSSGISGSKAQISIGQGDKAALPEDVKAAIGNRPLVQLTLSIDGKQTEWNNPNVPVTVSIPYTPTAAELANPESIVIWYMDGSGKAVPVPNGRYDAATGTVTFSTTHFSDYAVAYTKVSFSDVAAGAWYNKAVGFIAARGITSGTGNGSYSPEAKLTRAEFLVMMMRTYGITPDTNQTDNFADAGSTYYTGYLAEAKKLGIGEGISDNMFAPDREISRQEMFTLLYNVLKLTGRLPQGSSGKSLSSFSDAGQVASWAKDAMTFLVETGTIGGNNGKLSPTGTTTRAEMAQVLYNLLSK